MLNVFVVHVENKPGVLTRVASLFRRRAFNIDSLTVGRNEKSVDELVRDWVVEWCETAKLSDLVGGGRSKAAYDKVAALEAQLAMAVDQWGGPGADNAAYLRTKRDRMGHDLILSEQDKGASA